MLARWESSPFSSPNSRGATVVTTCSPRTFEFVSTLGADRIIDYTKAHWYEDAELASSKVDAVFDTVGTDGTFAGAKAVLNEGGSFVSIANTEAGFNPTAHSRLAFARHYGLTNDPGVQNELADLLAQGDLTLPIEDIFDFTTKGVTALLQKQQSGKSVGKNVLEIA